MAGQIKDKEAYQRLNYLYQAAHCVLSQNPENVELARFYCFTQRTIARRLVLRQINTCLLGRIYANSFCKGSISEENIMQKVLFIAHPWCICDDKTAKCLSCGHTKKLLNCPGHCLWVNQPEAQLDQPVKMPGPGPSPKDQPKDKKSEKSVSSTAGAAENANSA